MHSLEPIFKNRAARFWSSTVFRGMGLYFLRSFSLTLQDQQGEPSNHTRRQWEGRDWTASTERRSRIGRKGGSEAKWRKSDLDIIKREKSVLFFRCLVLALAGSSTCVETAGILRESVQKGSDTKFYKHEKQHAKILWFQCIVQSQTRGSGTDRDRKRSQNRGRRRKTILMRTTL